MIKHNPSSFRMNVSLSSLRLPSALGLLAALLLTSCGGPHLEIRDRPVTETKSSRALTSSSALASETISVLRSENLLETYKSDPEAAIQALGGRYKGEPTEERRFALAEMASDTGDKITAERPYDAIGHYLDAARLSEAAALKAIGSIGENRDQVIYNYCAARVARLLHDEDDSGKIARSVKGPLQTYRFSAAQGRETVNPASYDVLVPDTWLKPDGIRLEPVRQVGFGVAMVGHLESTPELKKVEPTMGGTGFGIPLNASLRFSGSQASLVLQNLMVKGLGEMGGKELPLAGNFTAPFYFLYRDGIKRPNKILATLRPDAYKDTIGLFSIEPYRKDKIPLIVVHGLMSTAEGWLPFANHLRGDPLVREKYQLVFFNYPTGSAIGGNAANLREALAKYRKDYDPNGTNPNMKNMVILGHSMGGILSNMQIRDSGDRLYKTYFTKEMKEMDFDATTKAEIRRIGFFDANSDIDRAILIASPLRGSDFATNKIGQLGAWLIRLPFNVVDAALGQFEVISAMTDIAQQASQRPRNSVSGLRPDNPLLAGVLTCPVRKGVPIHTIVAKKKPNQSLLESSDGVVAYTSAHLDEAVSEVVVAGANHTTVLQKDECFEEVWRILYLHVGLKRK